MCLPTRTGIELELWVIDQDGRLCDGRDLADGLDGVKPEFIDCLLEVRTQPHSCETDLRDDLQSTTRRAIRAAEAEGKRLVPLGTPLTASEAPTTTDRGRLTEAIYQDGVVSAKNCAGTHVHFERKNALRQLNLLTALDPALALMSSSPYYLGERGVDSARALAYREKCGREFQQCCGLWDYVDSLDEWEDRVDRTYEQVRSIAVDRGVDPEEFEAHFAPEDTVLNPVRLRQCQPTVEWRAPDSTLPSQVVQIAKDVGRLVAQTETKEIEYGDPGIDAETIRIPEQSRLRGLSRQAIRSGLGAVPVRSYLREMEFDLSEYRPLSSQLRGPLRLRESEARKLRLEQARRLRSDVELLTADPISEQAGPAPVAEQ